MILDAATYNRLPDAEQHAIDEWVEQHTGVNPRGDRIVELRTTLTELVVTRVAAPSTFRRRPGDLEYHVSTYDLQGPCPL